MPDGRAPTIPTLVCTPVGRPLDLKDPIRLAAVDLAPPIAARLVAGHPFDADATRDGHVPLPLALAALVDPQARALAWQGRLTFMGIYPAVVEFVLAVSTPQRAARFLAAVSRLAELRAKRTRLQKFLTRLRHAKVAPETPPPCDALFFPESEETAPVAGIDSYLRGSPTPPPFACAVATAIWAGIDERDLHRELAVKGRDELDLDSILYASLAEFGPDARSRLVDETYLWLLIGRWLASDRTDSDVQNRFSVALARWNARQNITAAEIRRNLIIPLVPGVDRKTAALWCRDRLNDIDREIETTTSSWAAAPATDAGS